MIEQNLTTAAESIAEAMARNAALFCLSPRTPKDTGQAVTYTTAQGPLSCTAYWDGESLRTLWESEGRPLNRAAAESLICNHIAALCAAQNKESTL